MKQHSLVGNQFVACINQMEVFQLNDNYDSAAAISAFNPQSISVCEGEEKKHKMTWLARKNCTQAITTTQIRSCTFIAATLFSVTAASMLFIVSIGNIGSNMAASSAEATSSVVSAILFTWLRRRITRIFCSSSSRFLSS